MFISNDWEDYKLIDADGGERLEKWGNVTVIRPDPAVFWRLGKTDTQWQTADCVYTRSTSGGGHWNFNKKIPEKWKISYKGMQFWVKPMGFKHMGIFPEQAANWDFIRENVKPNMKVLNMFAYTGGATVACSMAGAEIVHVDSSKGIVQMAKDNVALNRLENRPIRYMVDDCTKFVNREIKRGNKYDVIIMDPPSYGRGAGGEIWKIEDNLPDLLSTCKQLLSPNASFVIINSYTTGISPCAIETLSKLIFNNSQCDSQELALPIQNRNIRIPSGSATRIML